MNLKSDLEEVTILAQSKLSENKDFRSWLRGQDQKRIELAVEKIGKEVSSQIDCTKCANCCKALTITPSSKDVKLLSDGLELSPHEFRLKYLKRDSEGDLVFKQRPCVFLKENKCSVYSFRPQTCRSYPHLEQNHMAARGWYIVENTVVCPIVYNTYELLKDYFQYSNQGSNHSNG